MPAKSGIEGTWQGTLKSAETNVRIVWKITRVDSGGLKLTMFDADTGGPGLAASSIALQGRALKVVIAGFGDEYKGELAAERAVPEVGRRRWAS